MRWGREEKGNSFMKGNIHGDKEFTRRWMIAFIPFLIVRIPKENTLESLRVKLVTAMWMKVYIDRAPENFWR